MSRTFVILSCVVAAIALAASPSTARPRFGVVAGPQLTQLAWEGDPVDMTTEPRVDWPWTTFGGATAELALGGRFALATGLEYGEHADHRHWGVTAILDGTSVTGETQRQVRLRYVSLPLRVEWRPGRWRLGGGPEVRLLVSGDERWFFPAPDPSYPVHEGSPAWAAVHGPIAGPDAVIFESVRVDRWYDITDLLERWSLAVQFAAGREFPVGRHAVRADVRFSQGLTDQWKPGWSSESSCAAQLALGFLW